jgi:hypothetical protein
MNYTMVGGDTPLTQRVFMSFVGLGCWELFLCMCESQDRLGLVVTLISNNVNCVRLSSILSIDFPNVGHKTNVWATPNWSLLV